MKSNTERRKYPRIKDEDVSVSLSGGGFDTISQSLDLSASGIYCKVDRHIPVMTIVQLSLALPGRTKKSPSKIMDLDGVVVREHAVKVKGKVQYYDIAIFFNTLMPGERRKLISYIDEKARRATRK